MIFTQHYLACLSHASYLIGDETTGRAVVVDPRRDVDVYLDEAAQHGLTIERVIETHVHADFLSGHLELAERTGAVISYGVGARLEFPAELLDDGQRMSLGDVTLEVIATPGHTPESICVVVYEHPDDAVPYGVLTGDTLFVGDVGRPDLLAAADPQLTADILARRLYHSLHDRLLRLPDSTPRVSGTRRRVIVWQAPVLRDQLDDRRPARRQLRVATDVCRRLRRGGHRRSTAPSPSTSSSTPSAIARSGHCSTTIRRRSCRSTRCWPGTPLVRSSRTAVSLPTSPPATFAAP